MTDQQAYRRYTAEAVRLLELARVPQAIVTLPDNATAEQADQIKADLEHKGYHDVLIRPVSVGFDSGALVAAAQAWATLALAAAQDRVIPADRPIDDSEQCPGCGSLRKGTHGAHRNTDSAGVCWDPWHDS